MRFDLITIFPEFFAGPLDYGIVRRARESKIIEAHVHDLRAFTHDRHRTVDDRPFGGGEGMVMKCEPLFEAVESLIPPDTLTTTNGGSKTAVVLLSAAGKLFRQSTARRFAKLERIIFICGRYEGVDERVAQHLATDEISIGDYVLSGGELAAALILDSVTRLLPGALGNESSIVNESFSASSLADADACSDPASATVAEKNHPAAITFTDHLSAHSRSRSAPTPPQAPHGFLDYPHYTRPPIFRGWEVPEVLLSGNHADIRKWREKVALEKTLRNRPDLTRS
jgi:tRNA (guanine37-N1)-methyltransferase